MVRSHGVIDVRLFTPLARHRRQHEVQKRPASNSESKAQDEGHLCLHPFFAGTKSMRKAPVCVAATSAGPGSGAELESLAPALTKSLSMRQRCMLGRSSRPSRYAVICGWRFSARSNETRRGLRMRMLPRSFLPGKGGMVRGASVWPASMGNASSNGQ